MSIRDTVHFEDEYQNHDTVLWPDKNIASKQHCRGAKDSLLNTQSSKAKS
jgi:hypothetical protein